MSKFNRRHDDEPNDHPPPDHYPPPRPTPAPISHASQEAVRHITSSPHTSRTVHSSPHLSYHVQKANNSSISDSDYHTRHQRKRVNSETSRTITSAIGGGVPAGERDRQKLRKYDWQDDTTLHRRDHIVDTRYARPQAPIHGSSVVVTTSPVQTSVRVSNDHRYQIPERFPERQSGRHGSGRLRSQSVARTEERSPITRVSATLEQEVAEKSRQLNAALRKHKEEADAHAALKLEHQAQKRQIGALRDKVDSLEAALAQCRSELSGVEKFLTTSDKSSGSEVTGALRNLNEGVQQTVTHMAELMTQELEFRTSRTNKTGGQVTEQTYISELLGVDFMQALGTKNHVDNPILVEMALQAFLIYELHSIVSSITQNQSHDTFIYDTYRRMQKSEGQPVSGNWRALTYRYAASSESMDTDFMHTNISTIISGLRGILIAAGCTSSKSDIKSALKSNFLEAIRNFVSLAIRIKMIIGVEVVSENFVVFVPKPGSPFDETTMENYDDDSVQGQGTHSETEERQNAVLCTVEMGLVKRTRVHDPGEKSTFSMAVIMKPKVALVSILEVITHM